MRKLIFLFMGALLIAGCTQLAVHPDNLIIVYNYGTCMMLQPPILIDADGNGYYEYPVFKEGWGGLSHWEARGFKLSQKELNDLMEEIEESGFYDLNDRYVLEGMSDGICGSITITKDGVTKKVYNSNMKPEAFMRASELIEGIAKNKTQ